MVILPLVLFVILWLTALVATFVPVIPATLIIWLAALLYAFMTGFQALTWGYLIALGVLAGVAFLIDNIAAVWGARKFGGSSAAGWGALVGGLVGLFLGPLGFLFGPILGAVLAEMLISKKDPLEALRSGVGTLVGMLGGIGAKLLIHFAMGVLVLIRIFTA
jgi:uncharacterized protein